MDDSIGMKIGYSLKNIAEYINDFLFLKDPLYFDHM